MVKKDWCFENHLDNVGRMVIPQPIRRQYDIKAGDTLRFVAVEEGVLLIPVKTPEEK